MKREDISMVNGTDLGNLYLYFIWLEYKSNLHKMTLKMSKISSKAAIEVLLMHIFLFIGLAPAFGNETIFFSSGS